MDLTTALEIDGGITCVVGAGGKKSTLYELVGRLEQTVLTATVRIPIFDRHVSRVFVTDEPVATLERETTLEREQRSHGEPDATKSASETERLWPVGLVADRERNDRYVGYETDQIDQLPGVDGVEHVLVKADGARTRLLKAPDEHEPQLPTTTDTVLAIASCHAVSKPLEAEYVHRPARVAAITGRSIGDRLEPADVATVLSHPDGGLKRVPAEATYVPVINMVDDAADAAVAREIAHGVLESEPADSGRLSAVVLTSMIANEPLVDVID